MPAISPVAPVKMVHHFPLTVCTAHGGERVGFAFPPVDPGSFRVRLIRRTFERGVKSGQTT
jgi:hypothetical protein